METSDVENRERQRCEELAHTSALMCVYIQCEGGRGRVTAR